MKKSNLILLGSLITLGLTGCDKGVNEGTEVKEYVKTTTTTEHQVIQRGEAGADEVTITVAATGDIHGRIYAYEYAIDAEDKDAGFAKINTIVKDLRDEKPNMILMDLGDTVQGNSAELFNDLEVHPTVEAMNMMGYDTWSIGNHEFDFEKEFLERNIKNFDGVVLSANTYNDTDGTHFTQPYQIFEVEGVRVAVVGIIPPHIPMWNASSPENFKGLSFEDPLVATKKVVDSIEGQYDVLVGAFHLSREDDYGLTGVMDIVDAIEEFDVVFHGHEHAKHVTDVNGTPVMEPGAYGWALAVADINLKNTDGEWTVTDIDARNIESKEIEADKEILEKFENIHEESLADANTVVGTITADFIEGLDYYTGAAEVTSAPRSQMEPNAVIELINDVQKYYADADISSAAMFNGSSNLKAGDFKKKDVAFIYMYDNTLMGVNITGKNLLEYMEWSMSYYNTWNEGDVTVSFDENIRGYNYDMFNGVDYDVNLSKEAGNRVENATFNGEAIDPERVYKLAINNYRYGTLINNGWVTEEDKYYDSTNDSAPAVRDLIVRYVEEEKNGQIEPKVTENWRITGINTDYPESEKIYEMIRTGEITIPRSSDGRTGNIKSINKNQI